MKGDFTRISFDATNHFSQVLMQQGRVTLYRPRRRPRQPSPATP